ncbi:hypothetical protein N8E89_25485 (plasmid) [Phyllobacterium sp. A18/5-2]|uniref:hypothetical protein n=1 Tax=Phyllobacterium sp. A18/5-2 TaxID=2978392 RepID=UPI0021C5E526|nr:hypothetical protein [Phyllobacterium sp. A18/5-2]UXN66468.1 hypothetical protein N8E89_25485 [Phyllobacterium sp. A18/5-2]
MAPATASFVYRSDRQSNSPNLTVGRECLAASAVPYAADLAMRYTPALLEITALPTGKMI